MTIGEQLRHLVGLIHPIPDARATLICHSGQTIDVGYHPSAELSPCQLRTVVLVSQQSGRPDYTSLVARIELSGAVEELGAGICRRANPHGGEEQRWLTTTLSSQTVGRVLEELSLENDAGDLEANLRCDTELGVTAILLSACTAKALTRLDEFALALATACFIAEMTDDARTPS